MATVKPNMAALRLFMTGTKPGTVGADMNKFADEMKKNAEALAPQDSGALKGGFRSKKTNIGTGGVIGVKVVVYNIQKYSRAIDQGTGQAHRSPSGALKPNAAYWPPTKGRRGNIFAGWADRHGFKVAILKDIVHSKGTKASEFIRKGFERTSKSLPRLFRNRG